MSAEPLILEELSWPELAAVLPEIDLVLIPVGSHEQHGPNLAFCCDIALARAACERLAARQGRRLAVAPSIPWGISNHHMGFVGTVTLRAETMMAVVRDVVASLQEHGFERFLLVNGHGGNIPILDSCIWQIERELEPAFIGACTYYNAYDPAIDREYRREDGGDHACAQETSLALALRPEIVKRDALAAMEPGPGQELFESLRPFLAAQALQIPGHFHLHTENGCLGDARQSSLEYGNAMVASLLDRMSELVDALIDGYPKTGDR